MDALLQDVRYSVRRLLRTPGFSLIAVLTLALGIGANTAIFSLINALLLKPLAGVHDADRLVALFTADFSSSRYSVSSYPDYEDFRRDRSVFTDLAASTISAVNVARDGQVDRLTAEIVTPNYFDVLGMRPSAGRLFSGTDGSDEAVVVLSQHAWQSRYGADPAMIGRTVQLNGRPFTVVGVAAPRFFGTATGVRTDAWLPLDAAVDIVGDYRSRDSRMLAVLGRLAPGVSVEAAQRRMTVLQRSLFETYPQQWVNLAGESRALTVLSERDGRVPPDQRGAVFTLAGVLLASVALVLLICCANVANLLLARGAARQREVVIRYALGAQRFAVLRQLLTESLILSLIGAAAGIVIAIWTTDLLLAGPATSAVPLFVDATADARVLGFTLLVSVVTAALFGLGPALRNTRAGMGLILKAERTLGSGQRATVRDVLVGAQIALALVLSIGAGLLARTMRNARDADIGMNIERMVIAAIDLSSQGYDEVRARTFQRELRERLESLPDVEAVTYAQRVPIANAFGRRTVRVAGYAPQPGEDMEFPFNVVAADYFETMQLPIVHGRAFSDDDRADAAGTIIVNEAFARRFWPNDDAIGKQVNMGNRALAVVGVARNGKYWSISEAPRPYYYLPEAQNFAPLQLHVRARTNTSSVRQAVRQLIRELDPQMPILSLDTMEGRMMGALLVPRIAGGLVGVFAMLSVLLAAIGVYGVTSVLVAQRVPEIGLRVALGATTRDILRLVVGRAMLVASAGIAAGFVLAAVSTRAVESMLFGVSRFDPASFALAATILAFAALLAAYAPARRAARVQPLVALTH